MKFRVIDLPYQLDLYDRNPEFITFVYSNADPKRTLGINSFFYVEDEDELDEKIQLLESDYSIVEEALHL